MTSQSLPAEPRTSSESPDRSGSWRHYSLLALMLLSVALTASLVRDYGSQFGSDEWAELYIVSDGALSYATGRLLDMIPHQIAYQLVGLQVRGLHAYLIVLRVFIAILIYGLIRPFTRDGGRFALSVAVIYLTYEIRDWTSFQEQGSALHLTSVLAFDLLMLTLFMRYLHFNSRRSLIAALIMAPFILFMYDAGVPLVGTIAILLFLTASPSRRDHQRALLALLTLAAVPIIYYYALPMLGLRQGTYGTGLYTGLSMGSIVSGIVTQYTAAFRQLPFTDFPTLSRFSIPILITLLVVWLVVTRTNYDPAPHDSPSPVSYLRWTVIGVVLAGAGFAMYLPTGLARLGPTRGHLFTAPGSTLAIAGAIGLVTSLFRDGPLGQRLRWMLVAGAAAIGVATSGSVQDEIILYDGMWESQPYALRSLANQMPALEDNTLLVLMEQPGEDDAPFDGGWAFQYAVRYLYDDAAVGVIPGDHLMAHALRVYDDGIAVEPHARNSNWAGARYSFHHYDEIIFVTKDRDGRMRILDEIPPQYATPQHVALYDPYSRISRAYVPAAVQDRLPPVQPLDP